MFDSKNDIKSSDSQPQPAPATRARITRLNGVLYNDVSLNGIHDRPIHVGDVVTVKRDSGVHTFLLFTDSAGRDGFVLRSAVEMI